jgi:endoglucanase
MTKRPTRARSTALTLTLTLTIAALPALNAAFAGPVDDYGRLSASGNKIVGDKSGGEAVQLRGLSFQWSVSEWGTHRFFTADAVDAMIDKWGAQVIRAPLGISYDKYGVTDGYDVNPDSNWARVERVVDRAVGRGVYAIVDWHSHDAHVPAKTQLAVDFFTNPNRAGKYGNNPAVIFEIFNEPVEDVTWAQVKGYAETVIAAIRRAGFKNLILVGSPYWDLKTDVAANDPPNDSLNNIAFTFHFYANTHKIGAKPWWSGSPATFGAVVQGALDAGKPVFVSEWGTNDATDTGRVSFAEADLWHAFLDARKISSCAWAVAVSTNVLDFWTLQGNPLILGPGVTANWAIPANMTPHGRYVYRWLTGSDTSFTVESGWPAFSGPRSPIPIPAKSGLESITDNHDKGASELEYGMADGVLSMEYTLAKGGYQYDPYIGVGFPVDVSHCEWGIAYTYRGGAHTLRAEQSDVEDWAFHINSRATPAAADWTAVRIPWSYFVQPAWGDPLPQNRSLVTDIRWYVEAASGTAGAIQVKDAYCLGCTNEGAEIVSVRRQSGNPAATQHIGLSGRTLNLRFAQNGKVDIYDLKGSKIRRIDLNQGSHAIRMNGLPKGMYIVNAQSGAWKQSVKMFIK